jgi:FtsZ-interacting cell division protein ZipA
MTSNQKPEWFEISEKEKSSDVRRISKPLPILALITTVLILGVGAVVAQTQEESPASAVESISPTPKVQDQRENASVIDSPSAPTSKAPVIKAPRIAKPPTNPGGDGEDEFGERHQRGERGESHGFGDDD